MLSKRTETSSTEVERWERSMAVGFINWGTRVIRPRLPGLGWHVCSLCGVGDKCFR